MIEEKTHYKMYKAKKKWMVAGVTMFSTMLGTMAAVSADNVPNSTISETSSSYEQAYDTYSKAHQNAQSSSVTPSYVSSSVTPIDERTNSEYDKQFGQYQQQKKQDINKDTNQLSSSKSSLVISSSLESTNSKSTSSSSILNSKSSIKASSTSSQITKPNKSLYNLNLAAVSNNGSQNNQQVASVQPVVTNENSQMTQYQGLQESSFDTDKAVYNPGDTVHMSLNLKNPTNFDQFGTYKLNVFNPLTEEKTVATGAWKTPQNGGTDTIKIDWQTPKTDNQGYVLNLQLFTSVGKLLDEFNNAVDVDTDIYRHPRYGALTDYSANTIDQQKAAIDSFAKKYHMNMQMLYDCYFRPQNPCPDQDSWIDWHGDTISKAAIESDINQIHADGSKAFLYDMINAYTGEEGDKDADLGPIDVKTVKNGNDVQNSGPTGIFYPSDSDQKGQQFHCVIGNNLDIADQWYNDPANSQWQNYIIPKIMDAMQRMGFDGWQGDTNGQMIGNTYDNRGTDKTINDADFYYYFVQAAQKAMNGKYAFGLNAVNNVGQSNIATKSNPTFDYTELWPSSFKTYNDIGNVIEQNWQNDGKPLIVPAYLYDQWRNDASGGKGDALPKNYNDNVVRQLTATIMAHGGSPMILSDGGYLLDDEYYPWPRFQNGKSINMDNNLGNPNTGYMRHYFDFDTAYENILQDPALKANNNYIQVWTGNGVGQGNWVNRSDGETNTVYAFSKNKDGLDTLNMVNLMGSTNQWQVYNSSDNNQHNVQPQKNLWVKFYPSEQTKNIKHIYLSSPDNNYQGKRIELPFKEYTDPDGHKYVEFEVPSLEVWDLIYMTPNDPQPLNLATTGVVSNTTPNQNNESNGQTTVNQYTYTINYYDGNTGAQVGTATLNTTSKLSNSELGEKVQSETKKKVNSYKIDQDKVDGNTEEISVIATVNQTQSNPQVYKYTVGYFDSKSGASEGTYSFSSNTPLSGDDLSNKVQLGTKEKVVSYKEDENQITPDGKTDNISIVAIVNGINSTPTTNNGTSQPNNTSSSVTNSGTSTTEKPSSNDKGSSSSSANKPNNTSGSATPSETNQPNNTSSSVTNSGTPTTGKPSSNDKGSSSSSTNKPGNGTDNSENTSQSGNSTSSETNQPNNTSSSVTNSGTSTTGKPSSSDKGSGSSSTNKPEKGANNSGDTSQSGNSTPNNTSSSVTSKPVANNGSAISQTPNNKPVSSNNGNTVASSNKASSVNQNKQSSANESNLVQGNSKANQTVSSKPLESKATDAKGHEIAGNDGGTVSNGTKTILSNSAQVTSSNNETVPSNQVERSNPTSQSMVSKGMRSKMKNETSSSKTESSGDLPQTGERQESVAEVGIAMLGVVGTIGLGIRKRRYR